MPRVVENRHPSLGQLIAKAADGLFHAPLIQVGGQGGVETKLPKNLGHGCGVVHRILQGTALVLAVAYDQGHPLARGAVPHPGGHAAPSRPGGQGQEQGENQNQTGESRFFEVDHNSLLSQSLERQAAAAHAVVRMLPAIGHVRHLALHVLKQLYYVHIAVPVKVGLAV